MEREQLQDARRDRRRRLEEHSAELHRLIWIENDARTIDVLIDRRNELLAELERLT